MPGNEELRVLISALLVDCVIFLLGYPLFLTVHHFRGDSLWEREKLQRVSSLRPGVISSIQQSGVNTPFVTSSCWSTSDQIDNTKDIQGLSNSLSVPLLDTEYFSPTQDARNLSYYRSSAEVYNGFNSILRLQPRVSFLHRFYNWFFGWFRYAWIVNINEFASSDVRMHLRFLKGSTLLLLTLSAISLGIVMPMSLVASRSYTGWGLLERVAASASMHEGGWRVVVLWLLTCLESFLGYLFAIWLWSLAGSEHVARFEFSGSATKTRLSSQQHKQVHPENYTVMARNLQRSLINDEEFKDQCSAAMQDRAIVAAHVVLDFSDVIRAKRALYETIRHFLTDPRLCPAIRHGANDGAMLFHSPSTTTDGRRQGSADTSCGDLSAQSRGVSFGGTLRSLSVPELETKVLHQRYELNRRIAKRPVRSTGVGFLTFNSGTSVEAAIANETLRRNGWKVTKAPPPQDIIWENLGVSTVSRNLRLIFLNVFVVLASLLLTSSAILSNYLIPVAVGIETIALSKLKLSVYGFGPPAVLFAVNSVIIPQLVQTTANLAGHYRISSFESHILHGNSILLLLNTLVLPVLGEVSIASVLILIAHSSLSDMSLKLSNSILHNSGSFVIRYLINAMFLSSISQLLQLPHLGLRGIFQTMGEIPPVWPFEFGYWSAFALSILLVGMFFGVLVPPVPLFAALALGAKYWVDKYNFSAGAWTVTSDTRGGVARVIARYCMLIIACFQLGMAALFHFSQRATTIKPTSHRNILWSVIGINGLLLAILACVTCCFAVAPTRVLDSLMEKMYRHQWIGSSTRYITMRTIGSTGSDETLVQPKLLEATSNIRSSSIGRLHEGPSMHRRDDMLGSSTNRNTLRVLRESYIHPCELERRRAAKKRVQEIERKQRSLG